VDPTLSAVGTQDQPVGAGSLQQLDFVALVEDANLRRAELVRRIEQANQAVADLAAFVVLERSDAGRRKGEVLGLSRSTHGIRTANLLERRPTPPRQEGLVDDSQAGGGPRLVDAAGRHRKELVAGLVIITTPLAEERECGPRRGPCARGGNGRREFGDELLERRTSAAEQVR
jgi:hypothetical protein